MSIETLKLALEAFEAIPEEIEGWIPDKCTDAVIALRQAIEQAQKQEPVAKVVSTAPKQIWLDLGFDPSDEDEISFNDLCDATWRHDNATGYGIEYVRADLASPPQRQPEQEPVGINGLTEAETNATASVMGLVNTPPQRQQLTDEEKYALIEKHLGLKQRRDATVIDQYTGLFYAAKPYFDLIEEAAHGITGEKE